VVPSGPADDGLGVVDVGGSHLHAALVRDRDAGPELGERVAAALDADGDRETLLDALAEPLDRLGASRWVVALPGPFDYPAGRGDFAGVGKFAALAGVDLRQALAERLRVPGEHVQFLNDAVAYGLGEWWGTSGRPRRTVCITLGTGVGSAFLVDGDPVASGPGVPPHGWVHLLHLDGRPLEDAVSTRAVVAAYAARSGSTLAVREIAALARAGDPVATDVLTAAMRALGRALRPSLADFDADELVVGGSVSRSFDVLGPPLRAALALDGVRPLLVRPAVLLDDAPLLGAAWWFSRRRPGSPGRTP